EASGDWSAFSVSGVGDLDGDGLDDAAIGAPYEDARDEDAGAVYIAGGDLDGEVSLAATTAKVWGESADDRAGFAVAPAGDIDGDGLDDLLVGADSADSGATDAGAAYVVLGPVAQERLLADADARIFGEQRGDAAGFAVAGDGDANGDGYTDVLVGAPEHDG